MTREEMLEEFETLEFHITNSVDTDLTGFTERDIWFDNKGWGSYYIDEARNDYYKCPMPCEGFIADLKYRYNNGEKTFKLSDFKNTSLEELFNNICWSAKEIPAEYIAGLFDINCTKGEYFYCGFVDVIDSLSPNLVYYDREDDFKAECCDKVEYYEIWNELTEEELAKWYETIFIEKVCEEENYYTIDNVYPPKTFHVVLEYCTGDAMASFGYISKFKDINSAEQFYESCMADSKDFQKIIYEGFSWVLDNPENPDYAPTMLGSISLIESEFDLFKYHGFDSYDGNKYNFWLNMYESHMDLSDGSFSDFYEALGNKIARSESLDYIINLQNEFYVSND